jgi:glutamate racemase
MAAMSPDPQPIAVFDSGVGGLSVVHHLRQVLPGSDIVYFGDTARVPYGTKSAPTVTRFSLEIAAFLNQFDPALLVVACNTASALALPNLATQVPIPVIGVVEPGVEAALATAPHGPIAILGTEATIQSAAYQRAIQGRAPGTPVLSRPCPLFVPLAEEGRPATDPVVQTVVRDYLADLAAHGVQAAILGCTHYPLMRDAIAAELGPAVRVVDSGAATAAAIHRLLGQRGSLPPPDRTGSLRCFVSDNPERFRRVGSRFLGHELDRVEYVAPEDYIATPVASDPFPQP